MAASTNTNQINISGVDGDGEQSISSAQVVLLKDESLTLADGTAVDYSNYGNYKALKVTDDNSHTQYIVSLKGHLDVFDLAVRNSSGTYVKYPTYQHSLEYSDNNTPLSDIEGDAHVDARTNTMFIYGTNLGGTQTKTQRFNDIYQVQISNTWTNQGKYDLVKGLAVGDTVDFTMFQNQGVRNTRTHVVTQDGRLAELQGNSDIYIYYIKEVTTPNDERVDGNKTYTNAAQWSVRPGINKLLIDVVTSNNKKAFNIFLDAQGFRTGGYENGFTSTNFSDTLGFISFNFINGSGESLGLEHIQLTPDTEGYDKAGRFLGSYVTNFEANTSQFPIYVETTIHFAQTMGEYNYDIPHYWSENDAGYGSIGATNPDIMTGELLDDPWCLDRQYSEDCNDQIDSLYNPWSKYKFLSDVSATGGGGSATTITKKMYSSSIINTRLQFQTSITKQFNLIANAESGLRNYYRYRTKQYQVSTQDRPSMVRTISLTYAAYSALSVKVITENGTVAKNITFDATTQVNEIKNNLTVTKVVGVRAKTFELEFQTIGNADDILEISKVTVSFG